MELASENQIPGRFVRMPHGQPVNSILAGTIFTAMLIMYGNSNFVMNLTNVTALITKGLVGASIFLLVRRE